MELDVNKIIAESVGAVEELDENADLLEESAEVQEEVATDEVVEETETDESSEEETAETEEEQNEEEAAEETSEETEEVQESEDTPELVQLNGMFEAAIATSLASGLGALTFRDKVRELQGITEIDWSEVGEKAAKLAGKAGSKVADAVSDGANGAKKLAKKAVEKVSDTVDDMDTGEKVAAAATGGAAAGIGTVAAAKKLNAGKKFAKLAQNVAG